MAKKLSVPEELSKLTSISTDAKFIRQWAKEQAEDLKSVFIPIGILTSDLGLARNSANVGMRQLRDANLIEIDPEGCPVSMAGSMEIREVLVIKFLKQATKEGQNAIDFDADDPDRGGIPAIPKSRITEGEDWASSEMTRYTAHVVKVFISDESEEVKYWLLTIESKDIVGDSTATPVTDMEFPTDVDAFAYWDEWLQGVPGEIISRGYTEESERDRQTRERFGSLEVPPGGETGPFDVVEWALAFGVFEEGDFIALAPAAFDAFIVALRAREGASEEVAAQEESILEGHVVFQGWKFVRSDEGHALPVVEPVAAAAPFDVIVWAESLEAEEGEDFFFVNLSPDAFASYVDALDAQREGEEVGENLDIKIACNEARSKGRISPGATTFCRDDAGHQLPEPVTAAPEPASDLSIFEFTLNETTEDGTPYTAVGTKAARGCCRIKYTSEGLFRSGGWTDTVKPKAHGDDPKGFVVKEVERLRKIYLENKPIWDKEDGK